MAHELNLSALVEVHTTAEIKQAVAAGARIIDSINNRNFERFQCQFCNELSVTAKAVPAECYVVAESGIQTATQAQAVGRCWLWTPCVRLAKH
ncbi:hypothetical protein [Lactiplantibacillus plantarum]|uniref:hypothetical protein n=1 Tax=Lactiplantibacillus plantarum TaxID=1590 RepID=UPI00280B71EF|nr:hypothetical protein [Lactiplantibacillus plantarum]